ncbi:hypothetical protein AVEN_68779-1 [Araneus ventricosus]|uniref:Uncharacterized protein n=1 Tax=Araneus ventricosus TaxID=182803 RepID=A0A4Y2C532_ARAVE|nr:hypothetical protein AVEN_68779-1 [Araneus ventricosus]
MQTGSENPYETTLVPVPRAAKVDLLVRNQTNLLIYLAKGSEDYNRDTLLTPVLSSQEQVTESALDSQYSSECSSHEPSSRSSGEGLYRTKYG